MSEEAREIRFADDGCFGGCGKSGLCGALESSCRLWCADGGDSYHHDAYRHHLTKKWNLLSVRARWFFFLLGKTWCFTAILCLLALVAFGIFPGLDTRLKRMSQGDYRRHTVMVDVEFDGLSAKDFHKTVTPVFDEIGLIGECRGAGRFLTSTMTNPPVIKEMDYLSISMDRETFDASKLYRVSRRDDGRVFLRPK